MSCDELRLHRWEDDGGALGPEMETGFETTPVSTECATALINNNQAEIAPYADTPRMNHNGTARYFTDRARILLVAQNQERAEFRRQVESATGWPVALASSFGEGLERVAALKGQLKIVVVRLSERVSEANGFINRMARITAARG